MGKLAEWWGKRLIEKEKDEQTQSELPDQWETMKDVWHLNYSRVSNGDLFDQYQNTLGLTTDKTEKGDVTTYRYTYYENRKDAEPVQHMMEFDVKAGTIVGKRCKNV